MARGKENADIEYLMHVEALRRFYEESKDLERQVEDATRIYLDAKSQYMEEFTRIMELQKQILLNQAAAGAPPTPLTCDDGKLKEALSNLQKLTVKIRSDKEPELMNPQRLEQLKNQLALRHNPRVKLAKRKGNLAGNLENLQTAGTQLDSMEAIFDANTQMTIDLFCDTVQPPTHQKRDTP